MLQLQQLSDFPESRCETLISFTERSTSINFETLVMSLSVFSFSDQARPWNSRRSCRPYCSRSFKASWVWQQASSSFWTRSFRSWFSERRALTFSVEDKGIQDPDFRTRVRQDSAHFEQTGSDPEYGFIQVSGSGFSNFIFLGFDANAIMKRIFAKIWRM